MPKPKKPNQRPGKKAFNVILPVDLLRRIKETSDKTGLRVHALVERALEIGLKEVGHGSNEYFR